MGSRRNFLRNGSALIAATLAQPRFSLAAAGNGSLVLPTKAQVRWQDCEVGMVYHFDMPVAAGNYAGNNTSRKVFDTTLYNPKKLDTDQWIEAAKAAGARYAVFTATHFNGFMQWQSDLYPYGVKQAAWRDGKGDVVADFVASCRKAGIKPGIYLSTHRNVYQTVWGHYVDWGKGRGTEKQAKYNRIAEQQVKELCSRYGKLVQIWFDAGTKTPTEGGPDTVPVFEKYQPDSVYYHSSQRSDHRWIGNEVGRAGYPCWATMPEGYEVSHNSGNWRSRLSHGNPDGTVWSPGMCDTPLRNHNWFWKPGQDERAISTQKLVDVYHKSVGRNCNLLIGEVVTREGLVPESDIKRLAEFGKEIKQRFGKALASTAGEGTAIELKLPRPQIVDTVSIMEDITQGERIRRYAVEGLAADGVWKAVCNGESVGHKRIQSFKPINVSRIRLRIDEATATPLIRQLAVYRVV